MICTMCPSDRLILVVAASCMLLLYSHPICGEAFSADSTAPTARENSTADNRTSNGTVEANKQSLLANETTTSASTAVTTNQPDDVAETLPAAIEVTSQNYPKPYPGMHTANWSVQVDAENWTNIDVRILSLDIDETADILFFRAGNEHSTNQTGITLTGKLDAVKEFKLMFTTELYIFFQSNTTLGKQRHRGFQLTYAPFGRVQTVTVDSNVTTTTPAPIRDLHSYTIHLWIDHQAQTNETWQKMKVLLAESANQYTEARNLSLTHATPDNVILQNVISCPRSWAHHERCIRVRFAIPLAAAALNATLSTAEIVDHHVEGTEMSTDHLEDMWRTYGAAQFERNSLSEYSLPDNDYMLLMWSAVGLAVVIVFLLLLYSIWKMGILRDYHRMPGGGKADDQKTILDRTRSDIDISMFPSPHQIVPSLFPAGDPSGGGSAGLQHEYETRPIRFSREDFPASRAEHDKHHIFTPNIVNFNEPNSAAINMSTFMADEEEIFSRTGAASTARQRPLIRDSRNQESMT